MTTTYGYIPTAAGQLAPCPVPRRRPLRHAARVIAGIGDTMQHLLLPAALIILLAVLATAPATAKATTATPHGAATHIVACDQYLSHAAMAIAQQVGPAPTPAFCSVPANEQ